LPLSVTLCRPLRSPRHRTIGRPPRADPSPAQGTGMLSGASSPGSRESCRCGGHRRRPTTHPV